MSNSLGGTQIADTYPGLIKTCNNCNVTSQIRLTDGEGCLTSLHISNGSNGICAEGNSTINGDLAVNTNLNVTGNATIGGGFTVTNNQINDSTGTKIQFAASCITNKANTLIEGTLNVTGDVIAFCSSDKRLKDNIKTIDNSKDIVDSLNGYTFDWNEDSNKSGNDIGFIAQDVQKVLPNAVQERDNGYLAVDYVKLIPILLQEVKRLNIEIENLKDKV